MRYTTKQYAAALLAALEDKSKEERKDAIRNFLIILRKNRDGARLGLILKEVAREHLKGKGLRKVELFSATEFSPKIKKEIEKILGAKLFWEEKINPEILAGIKILVDEEILIDASGKAQLDRLLT